MDATDRRKQKLLAKSLYNKRDFANAIKLYTELCQASPEAELHYMLGVLYGHLSNYDISKKHLTEAIRLNPNDDIVWSHLGSIHASQGNYETAIQSLKKSLEINPKNIQSLNNLANVYRELGHYDDAERCYKSALSLDKKNQITINNIANIYLSRCQYDKAEMFYKKAIKLDKNYFDAYYNLGATYQSKGEHKLALQYYKRAQKIRPDDIQPRTAIANSYEKQAKLEKALEYINPLLAKNIVTPEIADIYGKICIKNKNYAEGITVINQSLATQINPIAEQALRFCLGEIYDKQGNYDDAFREYSKANTMRSYQYEKTINEQSFQHVIDTFLNIPVENNLHSDNPSKTPIFIVGMPRSGTTLIEQILSSHSEVSGAGELSYITDIARQSTSNNTVFKYPDNIKHLTVEGLNLLSSTYLSLLNKHGSNCRHITDKMPHNFIYVGFIKKIFPNCKIIHCLRNPLDVCLSIYFHNFNQNHPYTDNLDNLGHYYNQYRKLMTFWHSQYDDTLIDVHYEDLVSDTEVNVRKILSHVGLEWQDSCLKHYQNKRTVSTPSYAQVNQPLYQSSMERWKNYSKHIDELKISIDDGYLI